MTVYVMQLQDEPESGPSFTIVVDDQTMTWTTSPPGGTIDTAIEGYFSSGGPPGSGKRFRIFPDGTAYVLDS